MHGQLVQQQIGLVNKMWGRRSRLEEWIDNMASIMITVGGILAASGVVVCTIGMLVALLTEIWRQTVKILGIS